MIDGNSLINRAYYAMQRPMITKDGLYTQGVYGFVNMLNRIIREREPSHVVVAFDMKGPTFRHEEFEEYKAGRKKMPLELAMQLPLLKEVLEGMNISYLEKEGYEADDIIGTLVMKAEEEGYNPLIVTGDRDELQLASDKTRVILTKKGISEFEEYDYKEMVKKYGLTPSQFIDLKGLMGDKSDNIPGIPGVGEKTATELLLKYGSLEEVLKRAEEIEKPALREKVRENKNLAIMSKRLATIHKNVPIDYFIEDFLLREPDIEKLISSYKKLGFNSFLKKLGEGRDFQKEEEKPSKDEMVFYHIKSKDELSEYKKLLGKDIYIQVFSDDSHIRKPEIEGIFIGSKGNHLYIEGEEAQKNLVNILEKDKISIYGHSLSKDLYPLMMNYNFELINISFDTEVAEYVIDSKRSNYALGTLTLDYLEKQTPSFKEYFKDEGQIDMFTDYHEKNIEYGIFCETRVEDLRKLQEKRIEEDGLKEVLYNIELPLIKVLVSMEKEGFSVDKKVLEETGESLNKSLSLLTTEIHNLAGEEFNINSPVKLSEILFTKLNLPSGKKTQRGFSTGAEVLENIKEKHPIVPLILEYRTLSKLKSTYVEGLIPLIGEDDKVHPHFQQTVTQTGRISCTEPNLQNIPVRQERGRELRKAFIAGGNASLMSADYSQIELRILAHLSSDEDLIEGFVKDEDVHKNTASKVLGVPVEEVTKEQRERAKAVNFGVIYGMSGFGLSGELNISRQEAEEYIRQYFEGHRAVKSYLDSLVKEAGIKGYSLTLYNRKRRIPEITAKDYMTRQLGERLAMNSPIQGSAADIIKIAMINVFNKLMEENLKSRLILQVHDELIIRVEEKEEERVEQILCDGMTKAASLKVPLKVALSKGESWYRL